MRTPLVALGALCGAALLAPGLAAPTARSLTLTTPRGEPLAVAEHLPPGSERVPALVIAPGQGYAMDLPLVRELAERAVAQDMAVFRFQWAYHPDGQPSDDLSEEVQDMRTVLRHAMAHARVRASQVFLAGKSLGTIVAYRLFRETGAARGLALMTPLCGSGDGETGAEYYPDLLGAEERPVLLVLGDRDPLCEVPALYDFLDDSRGNVAVSVVGGDHGMNLGPWDDPAFADRNAANREAAHAMVLHHLAMWRQR